MLFFFLLLLSAPCIPPIYFSMPFLYIVFYLLFLYVLYIPHAYKIKEKKKTKIILKIKNKITRQA